MHSSPSKPAHYPPAKISSLGSWKLNLQVLLFQSTLKHHGPNHPKKHQETTKLNSIHSIPPNIFGLKTWFFSIPPELQTSLPWRPATGTVGAVLSEDLRLPAPRLQPLGAPRARRVVVRGFQFPTHLQHLAIQALVLLGQELQGKKKQNKRELKKPRLEFLRSKTKRLPGVWWQKLMSWDSPRGCFLMAWMMRLVPRLHPRLFFWVSDFYSYFAATKSMTALRIDGDPHLKNGMKCHRPWNLTDHWEVKCNRLASGQWPGP